MLVCALSLMIALVLEPVTGPSTPERELYRDAAAAIEQRELSRACDLLHRLVTDYAEGELAPIAAFHWAQCLVLQQRSDEALDVLSKWIRPIEQHAQANSTHSNLEKNTVELLNLVLDQLDHSPATVEQLESLLSSDTARRSSKFTIAVANELTDRRLQAKEFPAAVRCLSQTIEELERAQQTVPDVLLTNLQFELPVAWAEHELSISHAAESVRILEQIKLPLLSSEQELAVRFLLAEAQFSVGNHQQASAQFDWLARQAEMISPTPAWGAAIALRRGELLVRARDIPAAQQWLMQAKHEYPSFSAAYEFDYLLANCAVARIEFSEAQELLEQVIEAPAAQGTDAVPRAAWMLGEVYFLQRNYPFAMDAYRKVASMKEFPDWQARALVQSAKCHELLGQPREALADYQQAIQLSRQPELQQQAIERVGAIETSYPQMR